jgi:hypothetical protein
VSEFKPIEVEFVPDPTFVPLEYNFTPPEVTPVTEAPKPATGKKEI